MNTTTYDHYIFEADQLTVSIHENRVRCEAIVGRLSNGKHGARPGLADIEFDETFLEKIDRVLRDGFRTIRVHIGLGPKNRLMSRQVADMITAHKKAKKLGGRMILCDVPERMRTLLSYLSLDKVIEISNNGRNCA